MQVCTIFVLNRIPHNHYQFLVTIRVLVISNIKKITTATKHLKVGTDSLEFTVDVSTRTKFI